MTANVAERFVELVNRSDSAGFVGLFAPEGFVDDWGRRFVGAKAIRQWSDEELIGAHATLKINSIQERGDMVILIAQVGGDGFNGPSTFSFRVKDGAALEMKITA